LVNQRPTSIFLISINSRKLAALLSKAERSMIDSFIISVNLRELAAKLFPFRHSALGCRSFSEGNPFRILQPVYKPNFI